MKLMEGEEGEKGEKKMKGGYGYAVCAIGELEPSNLSWHHHVAP